MQKCLYEQEKLQIKSSFKNIFYNLGLKLTIIFIIINLLIIFFIIWCKKKKKWENIEKSPSQFPKVMSSKSFICSLCLVSHRTQKDSKSLQHRSGNKEMFCFKNDINKHLVQSDPPALNVITSIYNFNI